MSCSRGRRSGPKRRQQSHQPKHETAAGEPPFRLRAAGQRADDHHGQIVEIDLALDQKLDVPAPDGERAGPDFRLGSSSPAIASFTFSSRPGPTFQEVISRSPTYTRSL